MFFYIYKMVLKTIITDKFYYLIRLRIDKCSFYDIIAVIKEVML